MNLPLDVRRRLVSTQQAESPLAPIATKKPRAKRGTGAVSQRKAMNRWEREYAQRLRELQMAGEVLWFAYEKVKLKLADGTHYTPDFLVVTKAMRIEFREVKGFLRDDAAVKFKVAAELFPHFRFVMVTKDGGAWRTIRDLNNAEAA